MDKHIDLLTRLLEWYWDNHETELVKKWDNLSEEHIKQVLLEVYIYDKLREYK